MARSNLFRNQVNDIWQQAVDQLEEVKDALTRSRGRIEEDLLRLRNERDRLLKLLGEQTYKLANQGKLPVPKVVKDTVDRLNDVIDNLVAKQGKKRGKKKTKKKTARKKTKKKTKKRTAKKAAKKKTRR